MEFSSLTVQIAQKLSNSELKLRRPSHHGSILGRRFVTSQGRIDSKKADLRIQIAPNCRIIFKMIYNEVSYADFGIKTDF